MLPFLLGLLAGILIGWLIELTVRLHFWRVPVQRGSATLLTSQLAEPQAQQSSSNPPDIDKDT